MPHFQGQPGGPGHNAHGQGQTHYQGQQTYGQTQFGQQQTVGTSNYPPHSHPSHVLDDRDILTDLLLCQKQLLAAYGTATIESTNSQLRETLKQITQTEADHHTQLFRLMYERGWYETPRSDSSLAQQIASLWSQKIEQHEQQGQTAGQQSMHGQQAYGQQSPYGQHQQYGQQQQYSAGQRGSAQPVPGFAAARPWESVHGDHGSSEQSTPARQVYGQSAFGTPGTLPTSSEEQDNS